MAENDVFANHGLDSGDGGVASSNFYSLLTLERFQKLDLLIHLISNLRQQLVLSGPEGIGKTTFLEELQNKKLKNWQVCLITASNDLSFETIQTTLIDAIELVSSESTKPSLSEKLECLSRLNQKLVLLVDDAGELIPGLISTLSRYANNNKVLRIVFSLTPDELYVKNISDPGINECHFIDIPPLTEVQCGEFLQNLSTKPGIDLILNAITPDLVEKIYTETHGVPAKVVRALLKSSDFDKRVPSKRGLLTGIGVGLLIVGSVFWLWNRSIEEKPSEARSVIEQQVKHIEVSPPVETSLFQEDQRQIIAEIALDGKVLNEVPDTYGGHDKDHRQPPAVETVPLPTPVVAEVELGLGEGLERMPVQGTITAAIDQNTITETVSDQHFESDQQVVQTQQDKIQAIAKPQNLSTDSARSKIPDLTIHDSDLEWLLQQPADNYSWQLIVLSSDKSVKAFIDQYKDLQYAVRFFKSGTDRGERNIAIYGSFASIVEARESKKSLPPGLQKAWLRKMGVLQKQFSDDAQAEN